MGWGEGEVGCSVLGWEMVVLGEKGEVSGCWVIKKTTTQAAITTGV